MFLGRAKIIESIKASRFCGSVARAYWLSYFRRQISDAEPRYIGRRLYVYRDLL